MKELRWLLPVLATFMLASSLYEFVVAGRTWRGVLSLIAGVLFAVVWRREVRKETRGQVAQTKHHMKEDPNFEREYQIVGMYIDSAKSYAQLSTGALALVAVFGPMKLLELDDVRLLAGCVCFLVAALAGGAYQSLAVGRLERLSGLPVDRCRPLLRSWQENAYVFYHILVIAFHTGAIMFAVVAIVQLKPKP